MPGRRAVFPISCLLLSLPAVAAAAPAATTSRYMQTTSGTTLYNEGKSMAQAGRSGLVVLDFGQPWYSGGLYGTIIYGSLTFRSTSDIALAAENFARGFQDYSTSGMFLKLGIGTSNYYGYTGTAHGQAWAAMVNTVNNYITANGLSRVQARGADDIEPWCNSSGCTSPTTGRAWVDGFSSGTSAPMYNYGSADGCPPYGSCNGSWRQDDFYYVSWRNSNAWPVPEIYATGGANATQWQQISKYGYNTYGAAMTFLGSFTQYAACSGGGCSGTNNTPSAGWTQLYNAINSDPATAQSTLDYSTDITWAN